MSCCYHTVHVNTFASTCIVKAKSRFITCRFYNTLLRFEHLFLTYICVLMATLVCFFGALNSFFLALEF